MKRFFQAATVLRMCSGVIFAILLVSCGGGSSSPSQDVDNAGQTPVLIPTPIVSDELVDPVVFTDVVNVLPDTTVVSNSVEISGIPTGTTVPLSIVGGEYSINSGEFTAASGIVTRGDVVSVRLRSSIAGADTQTLELSIGSFIAEFSVTTGAADITPDVFSLGNIDKAIFGEPYITEAIAISGVNTVIPIAAEDGLISINNGPFLSTPQVARNSDQFRVRVLAPLQSNFTQSFTVSAGDFSTSFALTTLTDDEPPVATITFPFGQSAVEASTLVVSGTSLDNIKVASINVNGVDAVSDNGYATWQATIPLSQGINTLDYVVSDAVGNKSQGSSTATVDHQAFMDSPEGIAVDAESQVVYVGDDTFNSVHKVELSTGLRTLVSSQSRGSGPEILRPNGLYFDKTQNRLLLVDAIKDAVFSVDPASGDRKILSGTGIGSGDDWNAPTDIILAPDGRTAYVADFGLEKVVQVDLESGDRTVLSGGSIGSGPSFEHPRSLVGDFERGIIYIVDRDLDAIVSVDMTTGNRAIVASNERGEGPQIYAPHSVALSDDRQSVYFTDNGSLISPIRLFYSLIKVDISTGERELISGRGQGVGKDLRFPGSLALLPETSQAIIAENDRLILANLQNGDRTVLSRLQGSYTGDAITAGGIDVNTDKLFVGTDFPSLIRAINLTDAKVSTVFDGSQSNVSVSFNRLKYLPDRDSFVVPRAVFEEGFAEVRLEDSSVEIIASSDIGEGTPIGFTGDIRYNPNSKNVLYYDLSFKQIVRLDPKTLQRTVVVSDSIGSGAAVERPEAFDIDQNSNDLLVADRGNNSIYRVDLETLSRTQLDINGTDRIDIKATNARFNPAKQELYFNDSFTRPALLSHSSVSGVLQDLTNTMNQTSIGEVSTRKLALDLKNNRIFQTSLATERLVLTDINTGERVFVFLTEKLSE